MLIAKEKKKSNIAEYILYMWQVEDMLRAFDLDIEKINQNIVCRYTVDDDTKKEISDWYDNIIEIMKREKVERVGHIQPLQNTVDELTELHFYLLYKAGDPIYRGLIMEHANSFVEYRKLSGVNDSVSDVELALQALYGVLMLRLQGKKISDETERAVSGFSKVLSCLATRYAQKEEEESKNPEVM